MKNEIIICIGGVLLSALTYFAGVYRTERRYKKQAKEKRIENVLNRYMEFRKSNKTAGLDGLQKAGVGTLKNDSEIREVVNLIMQYGETDPLQRPALQVDGIDLKVFFEQAAKEKINFFHSKNLRIFGSSPNRVGSF